MAKEQITHTAARAGIAVAAAGMVMLALGAADAAALFEARGAQSCLISDGLPDHGTGAFPNRGNPNAIRAQRITFCFDAEPVRGEVARPAATIGMALNGVPIRPGTAGFYDASGRRGHSRDPSSGWSLEALGPAASLGLDDALAHVGPNGLYHYHAVSPVLMAGMQGSHLGYAADGFEIHYLGSAIASSWQLKPGIRPTAPGGAYDGSFVEDYEYVAGSGLLDECNGGMLGGEFVYFATDTYPFYPRCLWGHFEDEQPQRGTGARPRG